MQPVLGRLLTSADDVYHEGRPVAVLSENYWRAHGGDPSILNQAIQINGAAFTIVGIVRHDGLMDDSPSAIFLPVAMEGAVTPGKGDVLSDGLDRWLNLIGRLSPGVNRSQAEAQLNALWWNWRRDVLKIREHNIPDRKGWMETHLFVTEGGRGLPCSKAHWASPSKYWKRWRW